MVRASDQGSRHVQVGGDSSADIDHTYSILQYISHVAWENLVIPKEDLEQVVTWL